jgi:flagellar M-ring protein FliF
MFEELKNNLLSIWKEMDQRKRVGLISGVVLALLLVVALSVWVLQTSYEALFTDLEERDAAAVVAELKQHKIPYKVADGGKKILVPEKQVHETRIKLMGKGVLLNGGVGFEIFDNKDLGTTEYTQKINYLRALQGELARTILSIDSIKQARVHLVLPEASIFKREKVKPKASVSLVLKQDGRLSSEQILGIQRLVAASTPGLEPAVVTVLDQRGVTLSPPQDGDENLAGTSGKLRMKREVETYLTRKIVEVMDRTYGPGQAIVSVDVALNFDEIRRTDQDVIPLASAGGEPTGVVVRKRQSTYKQSRDGATKVADAGDQHVATGNLNATSEIEYEVSRRVQQVVTAPGGVRRISVGVLLPKVLEDEQVGRVRQIVMMVAGLNEERGDAIAVHGIEQLLQRNAQVEIDPLSANLKDNGSSLLPVWASQLITGLSGRSLLWIFLSLIILSAAVAIAVLYIRRRNRDTASAAEADRRRELLAEIKKWVESERETLQGVSK